ncbi:F0F1 ATP synthase subunit B [Sulfurimonas sp. HSL3-7]|uniref:F0F1 ATP synthase subunit B n=1 Tax=Sulfonitrofixus jiaomeiensis TaxID=3131938 RepID=UPI0031F86EE4
MSKILLPLLFVSASLFATEHAADAGTDIVQRTVNFVIFAGILWYLLAEPVKNYFGGRSKSIADELQKVQDRLRESKQAKEVAEAKISEATNLAEEIMKAASKEGKILNEKILKQCDADIENLQKQSAALMALEQRKMVRELVDEIMEDVLVQESASLDKEAMAGILMKKVA